MCDYGGPTNIISRAAVVIVFKYILPNINLKRIKCIFTDYGKGMIELRCILRATIFLFGFLRILDM